MSRLIRKSVVVRRLVRWLCVLPLLPQKRIKKGFTVIVQEARKRRVERKMADLLWYWIRTWRPKLHLLSVCGCSDRTTNASEADNKMLQEAVHQKYPNVWDFMGRSNKLAGFFIMIPGKLIHDCLVMPQYVKEVQVSKILFSVHLIRDRTIKKI